MWQARGSVPAPSRIARTEAAADPGEQKRTPPPPGSSPTGDKRGEACSQTHRESPRSPPTLRQNHRAAAPGALRWATALCASHGWKGRFYFTREYLPITSHLSGQNLTPAHGHYFNLLTAKLHLPQRSVLVQTKGRSVPWWHLVRGPHFIPPFVFH